MTADAVGVSRQSYGPDEKEAMDYCAGIATSEGLGVGWDEVANLVIELRGQQPDKPFMICGSHLDSVSQGGNFDGAAGVIAGLLGEIRMVREGVVPPQAIKVMALWGEESAWFCKVYLGSSALFGRLSREDLESVHRDTGRTLADYIRESGGQINRMAACEMLLDSRRVATYLELHIEQGPVMVVRNLPVAVMTAIRGNIRYQTIVCRGGAGHSGAVPRSLRRGAVFSIVELLSWLDDHWSEYLKRGHDLVVTTGMVANNPDAHAMSRIPVEVSFCLEIRSQSIETLTAFDESIHSENDFIGRERNVQFEFSRRIYSEPAQMDEMWIRRQLDICEDLDIPSAAMPSGAGHDAAAFASAGIPSAVIFIRNKNGSHNPREAMQIGDFMKGSKVLHNAMLQPS